MQRPVRLATLSGRSDCGWRAEGVFYRKNGYFGGKAATANRVIRPDEAIDKGFKGVEARFIRLPESYKFLNFTVGRNPAFFYDVIRQVIKIKRFTVFNHLFDVK